MKILLSIDDTDNMESEGTGELAEMILKEIEARGWGECFGVTRHQLLVHRDIPYTSHNSSMCFKADINEKYLESIIQYASDFLNKRSAEDSDPGLCVTVIDNLRNSEELMNYGRRAKEIILTKDSAYGLARQLGIHLSEHGGTGLGVIGALAGAGLRLTGRDGRFRGKIIIDSMNNEIRAKEICMHPQIDKVKSIDGKEVGENDIILLGEKVKTVLLDDKAVLLVYREKDEVSPWLTCTRQQLRRY